MVVVVEILVTRECPHVDAAIGLVGAASRGLDVEPWVVLLEVADFEQAERESFTGSPTIRVNGREVDPPAHRDRSSLACRVYDTAKGPSGIPDRRAVRRALREALTE